MTGNFASVGAAGEAATGRQARQARQGAFMVETEFGEALPAECLGSAGFRIGRETLPGPLLLVGAKVREWGGLDDGKSLEEVVGHADLLVVGVGAEYRPLAGSLQKARDSLESAGVGVEVASSSAACRAYNASLVEGRRVALALMPLHCRPDGDGGVAPAGNGRDRESGARP